MVGGIAIVTGELTGIGLIYTDAFGQADHRAAVGSNPGKAKAADRNERRLPGPKSLVGVLNAKAD